MSKPSKNTGIKRNVSPLRDKYTPRDKTPSVKFPPGEKKAVETTGNRFGK